MLKQNFTVATSVLVVFVILAFARHAFLGLIPAATTNTLAATDQKFLSFAGHEPIQWHLIEDNAFGEAKRLNKPILLVIGLSSSKFGRDFDQVVFQDPDVTSFITQNFYSIRIDGFEHPEWLNAILPVSRLRLGIAPGFQIWTMDPDGHVLSLIGRQAEDSAMDARSVYYALIAARNQFGQLKAAARPDLQIVDMQAADLEYLTSHPGLAWPSLSGFGEVLGTRCDRVHGGFPQGDIQGLYPNAWRFLTLTANTQLWRSSLPPLLLSRMLDVQDGGFFRLGLTRDISRIEFSKSTRVNAEMMLALALQGEIDKDPFYRALAESTFNWLNRCAAQNGLLAASQEDDENPQGRSPRLSFPTWRLHQSLTGDERAWAGDCLGLDPLYNAQMVPYLRTRSSLLDSHGEYDRVLEALRASTDAEPSYNDEGYLDVNGHCLARMLETARLWNDSRRLADLQRFVAKLKLFCDLDQVTHRPAARARQLGCLGDYLALSDALLEEYLAEGDAASLQQGLRYLDLARLRFQGARQGELNLNSQLEEMGGYRTLCVPEIADNLAESCTAQSIRLELAYGRLTAETPEGLELLRSARQTTAAFADIAGRGGPGVAGYFCAAAEVLDDLYAVAVGPHAVQLADELYSRVPTRFVAPAIGIARRDLQGGAPGIYLIGRTIEGPFSVDDAAARLPLALVTRR